ncbi:hypothetical protein [Desulfosporosinus fructosivorans]
MSDKEFGVRFTKTDNGFRIEVSGDEKIINAHHEMADAWKEFIGKARQVAKAHFQHYHHQEHQGSCDNEVKKEDVEIKTE